MFRQLAAAAPNQPNSVTASDLVQLHPSELTILLELAWNNRAGSNLAGPPPVTAPPGHPDRRSDVGGLPAALLGPALQLSPKAAALVAILARLANNVRW